MKRIIALMMIFALVVSASSLMSFAGKVETVTVIDKITGETKKVDKIYYNELERQNNERIKKYLTKSDIAFIDYIIKFKNENPKLSTEELYKIIFDRKKSGQISVQAESTTAWDKLTPSEKSLVIVFPKEALIVDACKKDTDAITNKKYPNWKDGDKGNAFRHALWNTMMALNIGKSLAKSFADAHEAVVDGNGKLLTDAQLKLLKWNGFDGLQHKNMDLNNNSKGRDCVAWYEFFTSNDTLASRVQTKINNGEMTILVK